MVAAIRTPFVPVGPIEGAIGEIRTARGGVTITARWTDAPAPETPVAAVSALAAALAMTGLAEDRAGALAEAEGLVTHLTSLVPVDEENVRQEGLPATRKIALDAPAVASMRRFRSISVHAPAADCFAAERSQEWVSASAPLMEPPPPPLTGRTTPCAGWPA